MAAGLVGIVFLANLVNPLVQWLSFTYMVGDDGIEMKSGVLSRNHRTIPFDRVQDVNLEQNVLHRLFGMAKVKLETGGSAGGNSEDGVIDSIKLDDAARLRDTIRVHRAGAQPVVASEDKTEIEEAAPIYAMDQKRVLLAGIFNFSLAVLGVLFGAAQTVGDVIGINPFSGSFWRNLAADSAPFMDFILANQIVTGLFGFISLVAIGLATGIIQTALREWNFRLSRTESGLRRRRGFFTLTDVVLPLKRVQATILATGPIRRYLGWRAMKLQSLAQDSGHGGDHVIAPLARNGEIDRIFDAMDWRQVDPTTKGWTRPTFAYVAMFMLIMVPALVIGFAISAVESVWAPAVAALAVAAVLMALRLVGWMHHRYRRDGDRVLIHSGAWNQRLVILPLDRIQSVDVHRGPIDKIFGVSSMVFGVAGGKGFQHHQIVSIPSATAYALRDDLLGDLQ
nr:PH domain-containing protein [Sphingomicrobium sp. B8]